jgi:hypothetical protein
MRLAFNISDAIYVDVDIHESVAEFNVSEPFSPIPFFIAKIHPIAQRMGPRARPSPHIGL